MHHGETIWKYAGRTIEKAKSMAAQELEVSEPDVEYREGVFSVVGTTAGAVWGAPIYRCAINATALPVTMAPTFMGASVHSDVHALVHPPGDASRLWIGGDGGLFVCDNPLSPAPTTVPRADARPCARHEPFGRRSIWSPCRRRISPPGPRGTSAK